MAYEPKSRITDKKHRLYEEYWGNLKSAKEIADENDVYSRLVRDSLRDFGIPLRPRKYGRNNSISPFTGFYQNKASPTDEDSISHFDENFEGTITPKWQKIAEKDPAVGDAATFND